MGIASNLDSYQHFAAQRATHLAPGVIEDLISSEHFNSRLQGMLTTLKLASECASLALMEKGQDVRALDGMMPYNHPATVSTLRLVESVEELVRWIHCGDTAIPQGVHIADYCKLTRKAGLVLRNVVQVMTDYNLSAGEVAERDLGELIGETTRLTRD